MAKPQTGLTTEPTPPPAQHDDVAAARARLMAAEAAAVEAREAEQGRRRDQQIVARGDAQDLLTLLTPLRETLAAWNASKPAGGIGPVKRTFSEMLVGQITFPISHVVTLEDLLGTSRTLNRLIGELGAPALLEPAQLEAHIATLAGLRERLEGIPRAVAAHRDLCAKALAVCASAQAVLTEYMAWLRPPTEANR